MQLHHVNAIQRPSIVLANNRFGGDIGGILRRATCGKQSQAYNIRLGTTTCSVLHLRTKTNVIEQSFLCIPRPF